MSSLHRVLAQPTPQTEPYDTRQAPNNAGGYSYVVDVWQRLRRFLILGTDGGTYYVNERKHTLNNTAVVSEALSLDPVRAVEEIRSISLAGRAPRASQALYGLAVAASHSDPTARRAAEAALLDVCRTPTHLFEFLNYMKLLRIQGKGRGWGRGLRDAVKRYYEETKYSKLALHMVKYRQRNGWTHQDVMRLCHPKGEGQRNELFHWATLDGQEQLDYQGVSALVVHGYQQIQQTDDVDQAVKFIQSCNLPWEAVPDRFRNEPDVWRALVPNMGYTALVRNLSKLTRVGVIKPLSHERYMIAEVLKAEHEVKRSRIHPIQLLDAKLVYESGGRLSKGDGARFTPDQEIVAALEKAFYLSFANVKPSGARTYVGVDVSSSMTWGNIGGSELLKPHTAAAVLALQIAKTEEHTHIMGFCGQMRDLQIGSHTDLNTAIENTQHRSFGTTDCALPMIDAVRRGLNVDHFVVLTDNETWAGRQHPVEALKNYRRKSGIEAKLSVVAMTATRFTIADPTDRGMLDVVGFDTNTPRMLSEFATGAI